MRKKMRAFLVKAYPQAFKQAAVCPILKKGELNVSSNYRPVSLFFYFLFFIVFFTREHILNSYCMKEETDMTDYS